MPLNPETTIADIAADEALQRELTALILDNGVRGAMWARHIGYDTADEIATGVSAGVRNGLSRLIESEAS